MTCCTGAPTAQLFSRLNYGVVFKQAGFVAYATDAWTHTLTIQDFKIPRAIPHSKVHCAQGTHTAICDSIGAQLKKLDNITRELKSLLQNFHKQLL